MVGEGRKNGLNVLRKRSSFKRFPDVWDNWEFLASRSCPALRKVKKHTGLP